ncbi:predicted protein [Pyrenophora tritici-repentis Pt-1C-BFP]|uniref:Uncharacterized protein n=1 Tax=Pyrenophora tritici-repentis (strain Pt-1C-BFP) TaxID=426418 RepID=B2VR32_PYRTR|nr:uncharacterized protein PTRG_00381 [Pyrenophora tritici-repentis Pt-1C-BFP]EDU39819.1 predicted protein [Pyrenophora tritici-repentis Pt-1C-BFP]PWO20746.1 hypothetical protein PtrARCrB10_10745 [Pyrenophora tritici-repentis]
MAPPPCVPCPATNTVIAANQKLFDYCPDCRPEMDLEDPARAQRGELDDVLQIHVHIKDDERGCYDEAEARQLLEDFRVYVDEKARAGMEWGERLENFLIANPTAVSRIEEHSLHQLLSVADPAKYNIMYLDGFATCAGMVRVLRMYVARQVPNKLFTDTFKWVHDLALQTNRVMETFHVVADAMMQENTEAYQMRVEFWGDVLIRTVRRGPGHGVGEEFFGGEGVVDGDSEDHPLAEKEVAVEAPVTRITGRKPSRKENGTLNIHGLKYNSKSLEGLLDHEPAKEVELNISYIPNGVNGMGVDVEDEHGNRLVWDDEGKSRLICAQEPRATTLAPTTKPKSLDAEPPVSKPKKPVQPSNDDVDDSSPAIISVAAGPITSPAASEPSSSLRKRKSLSPSSPDNNDDDDPFDPLMQRKRRKPAHLHLEDRRSKF